jgi:hypothetical protein
LQHSRPASLWLPNRFLKCRPQTTEPPSGVWRFDRAADCRMSNDHGHDLDMFAG